MVLGSGREKSSLNFLCLSATTPHAARIFVSFEVALGKASVVSIRSPIVDPAHAQLIATSMS